MESSLLSGSARTSVQSLKQFDSLFRKTSERLATGRKVNRANDGPSAFFTARALSDRAGGLNRVLDQIGTRLGAVQAAEGGLRAIAQLVRLGQSLVDDAASLPVPNPTATGSIEVAAQSDVTSLAGVADNDQFSVRVGSDAAVTVTVSAGDSAEDLLARLNAIENVQASFTADGALEISTTNGDNLTLAEVTGAPLAGLGLTAATYDKTTAVSAERAARANGFNAVLAQIDQLAGDSSFLGANLLRGDSPVILFNPDGTSSLAFPGADFSASGLGISRATDGFRTSAEVTAASGQLGEALDSLRGFSSRLSSNLAVADTRADFTAQLRNVLQSGADSLTLSDPNEDSAALLALETRKSFAATGFSIVQASERHVLSLFA